MIAIISQASPLWIGLAIVSYATSFAFRTWRWCVLRTTGYVSSRGGTVRCLLFDWFLIFILPARVEDIGRRAQDDRGRPVQYRRWNSRDETGPRPVRLGIGAFPDDDGGPLQREAVYLVAGVLGIAIALVVVLFVVYTAPDSLLSWIGSYFDRLSSGLAVFSDGSRQTAHNLFSLALALLVTVPV
ncbi:hypothetical protein U4E84_03905 [Halorubrum sp. AD140]|uniref:hypothetical protein n=1 Tax=Halorubrum sp. AD140 TaxID=3050073 RepID=UPI002ACCC75F|nr:hypothetical protein [Halorubrum sp. AD140]MDZ5810496.1 hypothetical protein [Halorubrum sp. AD140]